VVCSPYPEWMGACLLCMRRNLVDGSGLDDLSWRNRGEEHLQSTRMATSPAHAPARAAADLRSRLRDRAGVEIDRRPRHEPARGLTEDDPFEVRGRAEVDAFGDLSEDVLGRRTAGEVDDHGNQHAQACLQSPIKSS
jgi:hypothetical protein